MSLTFRIDDVSLNTDLSKLATMTARLRDKFERCKIMYGVSLAVSEDVGERVFPKIWNAFSDHRKYFLVDRIGMPNILAGADIASHGLVHVDHRHLSREAQELSILMSCSVLQTNIFIPPFNKWNADTESVCAEHKVYLVKFEDGWRHLKYEAFDGSGNWYFHTHDFELPEFKAMFP